MAFMARSIALFLQANPEAHALVVGSGPSQPVIAAAFDREGVGERLHMAGQRGGPDLADAYAAMDVFAFASHSETQGMVLTEAMAAAVPVVALDAPGVREVVADGVNGRLLPSEDDRVFADALEWTATRPNDARGALQSSARATAATFAIDRCADRALALYQDCIGRGRLASEDADMPWDRALRSIRAEWELVKIRRRGNGGGIGPRRRRPAETVMIYRIEKALRGVRRLMSRSEWAIRLLGLSRSDDTATQPGLVLIQIDGLSHRQFQAALDGGKLPHLQAMMGRDGYRAIGCIRHAVRHARGPGRAALWHSLCVPAFSYRDRRSGTIVRMWDPAVAAGDRAAGWPSAAFRFSPAAAPIATSIPAAPTRPISARRAWAGGRSCATPIRWPCRS